MKKWPGYILLLAASVFFSCRKEGRIDHLDGAAPAPTPISEVQVQETPGGAILTYQLPDDPNLSYVKAVYEIRPGVVREARSSYYADSLTLVGFPDTLSHEVKIYSVGRNEKASAALTVHVSPLLPPVKSVFPTLKMMPAFGGLQVAYENPSQAKLAISVLMQDPTQQGGWKPLFTFHTGASEGHFTVRGLDTLERTFGIFITDRWNNKSDTLKQALTPIYEEEIPKNNWKALVLPGDQTDVVSSGYTLNKIWDGYVDWRPPHMGYASSSSSTLPQWFTLDLGEKVSISRVVEHQGYPYHIYNGSAVKTFELWGSNNPDPDGSWASWDSLGTFHSFKPSGLPMGQNSQEDLDYGWTKGEDFEFDHVLPAYRYIRWKTLQTYSSSGQVVILEIDIYGQIQP